MAAVATELKGRSRWAQLALAAVVLVDLVGVVSDVAEYRLLGGEWTIDELDATDSRQAAIGIVQLVVLIATAVFFIRWFKRAYDNIDVLGRRRRYGTGWAIGAWFVPILNLWRPKQIANDIWRATNVDPTDQSVSPFLTIWWASFLIVNWIGQQVARLAFTADTIEDYRNTAVTNAVANSLDIVAALLASWVVRTMTAREVARLDVAEASGPNAT